MMDWTIAWKGVFIGGSGGVSAAALALGGSAAVPDGMPGRKGVVVRGASAVKGAVSRGASAATSVR